MKNYEKPELQVCMFSNEDVITTSGGLNLFATTTFSVGENEIEY